jgi:hypothetical protein
MIELENKTNVASAPAGKFRFRHGGDKALSDPDLAFTGAI